MSGPYPVTTSNKPHWTTWLAIGIAICALVVSFAAWRRPVQTSEPYSIQTTGAGRVRAIKLNKNTGETWFLQNGDSRWYSSEDADKANQKSTDPFYDIPNSPPPRTNQNSLDALDKLAKTPPTNHFIDLIPKSN